METEHMGYCGTALDHCSTLHQQDYLQSDFPIRSRTICFYPVFVILGDLFPIAGSTVSSVPSAVSRKLSLNLSHRTTTRLSSWIALTPPWLWFPGCRTFSLDISIVSTSFLGASCHIFTRRWNRWRWRRYRSYVPLEYFSDLLSEWSDWLQHGFF